MLEIETKYSFEGDLSLPETLAADVGADKLVAREPLELKASYYDTADLRLARNGVTLRHRSGDEGGDRWTVKLPANGGRDEIELDAPPTKVPPEARDLVTAFVLGQPVKRVVSLKTKRTRWSFMGPNGTELAELVDDHVVAYKSGRVAARFRELEVESRDGSRKMIARIGTCLEEIGARATDGAAKVVRALGPEAAGPPDVLPVDSIPPSAPATEAVRAAIASAAARLQANDPRARLGEPEGVHQMRVGARHLRSDLRTFAALVDPDWAKKLTGELKWIADVLGEVRDLDVISKRLDEAAEDLKPALRPLFDELKARDAKARSLMLEALRSKRYEQLLETLIESSTSPPVTQAAQVPCEDALPPLVAARWVKLRDAVRALAADPAPDDLHDIRIKAKKTRYAAEAVSIALGKKDGGDAARFAELCSRVQDTLGIQQDTVVATSVIEEAVRQNPNSVEFSLAAGRLIEREALAGANARSKFEKAWDKLDRKKIVGWMQRS